MSQDLSRRKFLAGSGIAAAGALALGLVGCAPKSAASSDSAQSDVDAAATDTAAAEDAGATATTGKTTIGFDGSEVMPWLPEEPEINDADVEEELDADVVIVGLGDAGTPACRAAVEAGAKVVALERCANNTTTGSDLAALGGKTQENWGRGAGFLDKKTLVDMHMAEGKHHCRYDIINRWADESGDMLDWFIEPCSDLYIAPESYADIPEANQAFYMYPYVYPLPATYDYTKEDLPCYPTSVGFNDLGKAMNANLQVAIDGGADIRTSTIGEKLILDDEGGIAGIYARNLETGGYIKINAPSVVLATGDYNSNPDMLAYYQPEVVENGNGILAMNTDAEGNPANDGSGHKLGVWAGAKIEQWHAPMIHHMGGGAGPDGRGVIGNNGYLWLNLHGERFMNEDLPGQQLENQVEMQPECTCYQFFDGNWPQQLEYFPAAHGVACYYRDEPLPEYAASGLRINVRTPEDIQAAVDDGRAYMADTIDELLEQLPGIDVEKAKASIERYNELAASGTDTDFGKSAQRLFPLDTPPFYAAECGVALTLANLGGIESDAEAHAYDTDRNIIPGLYVCGGVQGGRFNVEYPISLKGLSIAMCILYGKVAGTNAAARA